MTNPYISKVRIKNYRNFLDVEVDLSQKQVVIGENNVGKTNFLRAIQLILDRSFSDSDRHLQESDFHDSLEAPMENGEQIQITIQVQGYAHSRKLRAQFTDAVVSSSPPTLEFTYKYVPVVDEDQKILRYEYKIFKGNNEQNPFTSTDRNYINIYVIKALRDVERELKANKHSPLYKLVQQYDIQKEDLQEISEAMQGAADEVLKLDEIVHIKQVLQERFTNLAGLQSDYEINLRTFDVDVERLLYALQVYMGIKQRPVSELSLGLTNILFVSLLLILLKDKTVPPILRQTAFDIFSEKDSDGLLSMYYRQNSNGNFILRQSTLDLPYSRIYNFMDENNFKFQPFTILAVEEPEAHLHPVLQRLIYREVLHKSETSVIFTSHSPHITSVAPLNMIVHLRSQNGSTEITSTASLEMDERDINDLQRYLDARRGELYFGKGVVLVEGIAEEFVVPTAASLFGTALEDYGIVVCNINSTNFKPYAQLLTALSIPYVVISDGDYYELVESTETKGEIKKKRKYHILKSKSGSEHGYRGNEIAKDILIDLGLIEDWAVPEDDFQAQDELFNSYGIFIGRYTLEVDILSKSTDAIELFKLIYSELILGGDEMKDNFEKALDEGDLWGALGKIEANVGKGRFAQRLAGKVTKRMIPNYVKKAIETIIEKIKAIHE